MNHLNESQWQSGIQDLVSHITIFVLILFIFNFFVTNGKFWTDCVAVCLSTSYPRTQWLFIHYGIVEFFQKMTKYSFDLLPPPEEIMDLPVIVLYIIFIVLGLNIPHLIYLKITDLKLEVTKATISHHRKRWDWRNWRSCSSNERICTASVLMLVTWAEDSCMITARL